MTDIELVKSKIDIVDFISEHVALKRAGRHFKGLCPFHSEKTPSFIVSPERQSWHCFGACAIGGDAISFMQKYENLEFVEALKILAERVGVSLTGYAPTDKSRLKEKLYEINHLASEYYHYILTSHTLGKRAQEYLKERQLKEETVKTFLLGYSPNSWDSLSRFLLTKGYKQDDLYLAGLSVKGQRGGFYDRFRGRLMFTLKDHRGNVVGFSGRKLPPESEKEAKYINTSETPVYIKGNVLYGLEITKESIKKNNEAVVVEGELDMLSSFQAGVTNVVAIKGSALTEGQVLLLKRYTENILLALDSDFAGNEAARRGIEIADSANLNVKVIKLLFGKDPAECVGKGAYLWKDSVKKAIPVFDFIIEQSLSKYDKKEVIGKKKISFDVIPFIAKITNPVVKSHYVKLLVHELEVSEESIETMIDQYKRKERVNIVEEKKTDHAKREELMEEHFLSLIIQSEKPKEDMEKAFKIVSIGDFNLTPIKSIMETLLDYFTKHQDLNVSEFGKLLTAEVSPSFDLAYMKDISAMLVKDGLDKEIEKSAKEIRKFSIRRRINILSTKLSKAEEEKKEDVAKEINEEIRDLLAKLMIIE